MAKLVSGCKTLKTHNNRLKGTMGNINILGNLGDAADVNHLVL